MRLNLPHLAVIEKGQDQPLLDSRYDEIIVWPSEHMASPQPIVEIVSCPIRFGNGFVKYNIAIFNEAHTILYELIMAGAKIGESMVPDISIGSHWAKHWDKNRLGDRFGDREKFPHRYPKDHPQAKSNPQIANCYPLDALGEYRRWLQTEYLGGGKFKDYLAGKRELPPSVAQLAIERLTPKLIGR